MDTLLLAIGCTTGSNQGERLKYRYQITKSQT